MQSFLLVCMLFKIPSSEIVRSLWLCWGFTDPFLLSYTEWQLLLPHMPACLGDLSFVFFSASISLSGAGYSSRHLELERKLG